MVRLAAFLLLLCIAIPGRALTVSAGAEDNLTYQLDCLAGLIRCTRQAQALDGAVDANALARWRLARTTTRPPPGAHGDGPLPGHDVLGAYSGRSFDALRPASGLTFLEGPARARFDDLWPAEGERLARLARALRALAVTTEWEQHTARIRHFLGTDDGPQPRVVLIAIDDDQHGSIAARDSAVMYVESPPADSARARLPVLMHEWVHAQFSRMPASQAQFLVETFAELDGRCAIPAYHLFEEVLASAIGNGYFEQSLQSPERYRAYAAMPGSFYALEDIDLLAKAIVTLVGSYLDARRALDADFVRRFAKAAEGTLGARCDTLTARLHTSAFVLHGAEYGDAQAIAAARLGARTRLVTTLGRQGADGTTTMLARYGLLSGIVVTDQHAVERLTGLAPEAVLSALATVAAEHERVVFAWPRNSHAEIYFVVGSNPAHSTVALLQLVALREHRFRGWWLPPPLPD